jgi:hypothetical protein
MSDLNRQGRFADAAHPIDGADHDRLARLRPRARLIDRSQEAPQGGKLDAAPGEVGNRTGKLPWNGLRSASRLASHPSQLIRNPGQHAGSVLALQVGEVVIDLVG